MEELFAIVYPLPIILIGCLVSWTIEAMFPGLAEKGVKWMEYKR